MNVVAYNTLPLPEACGFDPHEVIAKYHRLMTDGIPTLVIRNTTLEEVHAIVIATGLVTPSSAFNDPRRPHEDHSFAEGVQYVEPAYHVDGLPIKGKLATLHHHKSTRRAHELTAATFAAAFINDQQPMDVDAYFNATVAVNGRLEETLRTGKRDPGLVAPLIYRGVVGTEDVVAIRTGGESPTIHDFRTLTEVDPPRGAIVRGYTATRLPR